MLGELSELEHNLADAVLNGSSRETNVTWTGNYVAIAALAFAALALISTLTVKPSALFFLFYIAGTLLMVTMTTLLGIKEAKWRAVYRALEEVIKARLTSPTKPVSPSPPSARQSD